MLSQLDPEMQKMMTARFSDIIKHLKELDYKDSEIRHAIDKASQKILIELSKENQRLKKEAKKKMQP